MGVAYSKDRRMRVLPHAFIGQFAGLSIETGRNDRIGSIQGFVARAGGGLQAANVLRYRFSGHGSVCGGVVLSTDQRAASTVSKLLKTESVQRLFNSPPLT
jgi:hypothetical protein